MSGTATEQDGEEPLVTCASEKGGIGYYAINLARSSDRWTRLAKEFATIGLPLQRVEGVDGASVAERDWTAFDTSTFRRRNGRDPRPGEYGCHRSHVRAIEIALASDRAAFVILEDDASVGPALPMVAERLLHMFKDRPRVVRLSAHRHSTFEPLTYMDGIDVDEPTGGGATGEYALGRCWHGPTGSASATWYSRTGAKLLLAAAQPGTLPWDIEQERSWATGVPFLQTRPDVTGITWNTPSTILTGTDPRYAKFAWWRRTSTLRFRVADLVRRIAYCATHRRA